MITQSLVYSVSDRFWHLYRKGVAWGLLETREIDNEVGQLKGDLPIKVLFVVCVQVTDTMKAHSLDTKRRVSSSAATIPDEK